MSRVGDQKITIAQGITVKTDGNNVEISGVKGQLSLDCSKGLSVQIQEGKLSVVRQNDNSETKALQGLNRSKIQNAIIGVSLGWQKTLQLVGVGFRAQTDGKKLTLTVGYSHPVKFVAPDSITITVVDNNITVSGCDKELVGETAARIRRIRPPEIYKGKGIRYKDEIIHLKPGKAAKTVGIGTAAK